jgi:hypothetical protein
VKARYRHETQTALAAAALSPKGPSGLHDTLSFLARCPAATRIAKEVDMDKFSEWLVGDGCCPNIDQLAFYADVGPHVREDLLTKARNSGFFVANLVWNSLFMEAKRECS